VFLGVFVTRELKKGYVEKDQLKMAEPKVFNSIQKHHELRTMGS
jgi:hypothetical protein